LFDIYGTTGEKSENINEKLKLQKKKKSKTNIPTSHALELELNECPYRKGPSQNETAPLYCLFNSTTVTPAL